MISTITYIVFSHILVITEAGSVHCAYTAHVLSVPVVLKSKKADSCDFSALH